jgi:troponin T
MSSEEEYSEEEVEEVVKTETRTPVQIHQKEAEPVAQSEAEVAMEEKLRKKKEEEEQMWNEYMEQRKKTKAKEEEDLKKLKDRQQARKAKRADQEKMLNDFRLKQEARRVKEMEEKRSREAEAKRKRLEDAERKRAAMQAALANKDQKTPVERNFVITKRTDGGPGATLGNTGFDRFTNVISARSEMGKTKEQLAEDKKNSHDF